MSQPDIQEIILKDLDILLQSKNKHNGLNIQDIIEIGAYVGASVLRARFKITKEVQNNEINGVFGIIGNFYVQNFKQNFTQVEFDQMLKRSLDLLQTPTFDQDCLTFFDKILSLKPNKQNHSN